MGAVKAKASLLATLALAPGVATTPTILGAKRKAAAMLNGLLASATGRRYGFRDCKRRLCYLATEYLSATLVIAEKVFWQYSVHTLRNLVAHLANNAAADIGISQDQHISLFKTISGYLKTLNAADDALQGKTKSKTDDRPLLVFPFDDPVIESLQLRQIIDGCSKLLPSGFRAAFGDFLVVYTTVPTLQRTLCDSSLLASSTSSWENIHQSCRCHEAQFSGLRESTSPVFQHICAGTFDSLHPDFTRMISYGLNFRCTPASFTRDLAELHTVLDDIIENTIIRYDPDRKDKAWDGWGDAAKNEIHLRLNSMNIQNVRNRRQLQGGPQLTDGLKDYINSIKEHFVICQMDKVSNNPVIICTYMYADTIIKELNNPVVYQQLDFDDCQDCIDALKKGLDTFGIPLGKAPVGNADPKELTAVQLISTMRCTWKLHKAVPAPRFITSAHRCGTACLSDMLGRVLRFLTPYLKTTWKELMRQAGLPDVATFPIIKSSTDLLEIIELYHRQTTVAERVSTPPVFQAYDIDSFYPSILHAELLPAISSLLDTAWGVLDPLGNKCLRVAFSTSGKRGTTLPIVDATAAPLPRSLNVDKSVIMDMLRVLLKHSYVRFGAKLVLQKNGLPMGTQSGPDLANCFGFFYELTFLRALVADISAGAEPGASNARRSCAALTLYARFIDDVLNFNNLQFQQILNVYPPSISFTAATPLTTGNIGIPYLDARIFQSSSAPHQVTIRLYDKRRDDKYKAIDIIQYTHWDSFLPYTTKINIFTSQFYRFTRLLTNERSFHLEVAICLCRLIVLKGYPRLPLMRKLRKLLFQGTTRYIHGVPVHRAGFHHEQIRHLLDTGERRGLPALLRLAAMPE